jgi:hypothetical protein
MAYAAVMFSATLSAAQYDRLLDAIYVPDGAYFDTGYVVKDHPRVIASISVAELDYDFDLFGVKHRSEGCWILNIDGTTTGGYHPAFYYRHGTVGNNGGVGEYSTRQRLDIDCGKTLIVNGEELQSVNDWDFSSNDTTMTIPGTEDAHRFTLIAFQLWDGGTLVRDFLPAEKDGVCGLYDRANDQFYAPVSGTVTEACGERVDAIHIPNGAYFETGCVVKKNPRVIADVSADWTSGTEDLDVFGVAPRGAGCWILNLDVSNTSGQNFYYRYGTASSGGAVGSFSAYQRLLIDCGKTLVVNGTTLQTCDDYDFSGNEYQMRVPGNQRYGACTLRSFKIEDGGQLVRDFVPAVKNGACGLFDRVACQFYTSVGTGTVTAEPYDRLLEAIHIPGDAKFDTECVVTNNPRVVADVSADTMSDFDLFGVKTRSEGCWILNLDSSFIYYRYGTASSIPLEWPIYSAGQRFQIDCGKTLQVNGTALTTANDYDFSGNDTTMTIPGQYPGGCTIWSFNIIDGGEYARVFLPAEKNGVCGLYDRVNHQFYAPVSGTATPVATAAPTELTVMRGDFPNPVPVLSWRPALGSSGTSILRAPGANGPWTEVAQVGEYADTYVDASAPVGVLLHYRVAANFPIGGDTVSVTNETSITFRRWRLLERDAGDAAHLGDLGHLRSGVNVIYNCGQEGKTPVHDYTWEAVTNSILTAFNNVLYRENWNTSSAGYRYVDDWVGVVDASPSTCIGVDLGEAAHVAHARFYAVTTVNEGTGRVTGLTLYGSNDPDWIQDGNHTALTEPLVWSGFCVWHDNDSLDTTNTYRYLYYTNPGVGWGGNTSEIQLYGWLDSDLEGAQAVENIVVSYGSGATPSVTLTWTPASHGTYTIERKTGDGAWEVVDSNLSAATTSWTDSSVTVGTLYTYRVKTTNGSEVAYSADCTARPYIVGGGIGLHGVWSSPYATTGAVETVVSVETNATMNFSNVSVGGSTENFFVSWSGKLIVPFGGNYVFEAESDDAVNLWIDKVPVLYRKAKDTTVQTSSSSALTAGEHDIVMTWFQKDGDNVCRLYWSGAVERAIIPASQLVPVANALPECWSGARTFSANSAVCPSGDVLFGNDGSISFAYGGSDVANGEQGYNFLWQPFEGNFVLTAKIESDDWTYNRFLGEKCGLMVRAGLAASDPFAACFLRWRDNGDALMLGDKYRTARGEGISAIDGEFDTTAVGVGNVGWLRLRRDGDVFTFSYRGKDGNGATTVWRDYGSITDSAGAYGKTVYVGLTSSGSLAPFADVPYYNWNFSNVSISAPLGMKVIIR